VPSPSHSTAVAIGGRSHRLRTTGLSAATTRPARRRNRQRPSCRKTFNWYCGSRHGWRPTPARPVGGPPSH